MPNESNVTLRELRSDVGEWLDQATLESGSVDIPKLRQAATRHFAGDRDFTIAWFRLTLHAFIDQHCNRLIREDPDLAKQGDRYVPRPVLRATLETMPAQWERFAEFDPETAREVPILEMGRDELLRAAHANREAGHDRYVRASLLELLAEPMKDGERVRDRWTWDDVEVLETRLQATIRNGLAERIDVRGALV